MRDRRWYGIFAAMTTPFAEDGSIDMARLVDHAKSCIAAGCAGISAFGTTGEGPSIGTAEREQVLEALTAAGIPGDRIIPGTTVTSVDDAAASSHMAAGYGCRGLLVTPPIYYKDVWPVDVTEWFAALLGKTAEDGPGLILYNIPQMTGVRLERETIAALKARFPDRVVGVKDSSGDWANAQMLLEAFPDLAIMIGDERLLQKGVRLGAAGSISGVANFRADLLGEILDGGQASPALESLVDALLLHPATPAVKALVGHVRGDKEWRRVRAPLRALAEREAAALGGRYEELFGRVGA